MNYKKTLLACYLGGVTQAISANFIPLLFITFKNDYDVSFKEIAFIPIVFFFSQLIVDLIASKYADKIGYRICVVVSQILSALGLILMTILPDLFISHHFTGILISVVFYAIGSGIIEVLTSPIVEARPFENKEGAMSLLHSFYCWGTVAVILLSTLFFSIFGLDNWKILIIIWSIVPIYNTFNFLQCPIVQLKTDKENNNSVTLIKTPVFWIFIVLMICAGSSEVTMAQWSSAFIESALGIPKVVGDLAGPCLFACFMGITRTLYGKFSQKLELTKIMLLSGILCVFCYLVASLSTLPIFGLVGCAICGFAVGIMWPGSISISSQKCPTGGTALFALLALAGDLGSMIGPAIVGNISKIAGENLKIGLLVATVFPIILLFVILLLRKNKFE